MTLDTSANEEHVRRLLRKAFAGVECPKAFKQADACGPVSHEVALQLRKNFYDYEPEEIHYLLPYVLEDMMNTRTGDDIETQDAERLVLQLDPLRLDNSLVRVNLLNQLAGFTPQQAEAICEWLRMARTWNDLTMFTDWVDASITYWCTRATGAMNLKRSS